MSDLKSKERLDKLLVAIGLLDSREKAQALILAGEVLVDNVPVTKCGTLVSISSEIRLRNELSPYVGRGGLKLEGALRDFNLDVTGLVCLDLGSSTGGFTDCLLQKGASLVYAVDVGTNQLAHKIRVDERVRVFEKTHANSLVTIPFEPAPNFVVVDVSFISLCKVLPFVIEVIESPSDLVMLIKPQFELEPEYVTEGGILKDQADVSIAIERVRTQLTLLGLKEKGLSPSCLKGKKSENQEYFIWAQMR
jgi:23S rRNA (cytidine1920-2'-O)/16S rRNA (cytidine1409-2'-O)-methyltransferase